jgi:hypothetical protein
MAMVDAAGRLGAVTVRKRQHRVAEMAAGWLALCTVSLVAFDRDVAVLHDLVTGKLFHLDAEMTSQAAVVGQIPKDVCVEADDRIAGHLTGRDYVSIPGLLGYTSDFIVLDLSQDSVGGNDGAPPGLALAETVKRGYRLMFVDGSLEIWQSPTYSGPRSTCSPLGAGPRG